MIQSLLTGIVTFIFIFGWKITPLVDLIFLTSLALVFISFVRGCVFLERTSSRVLCCMGMLSLYSLAIVLYNGLLDTQIAMRSIRSLINFLGAVSLVSIYWHSSSGDFFCRLLRDIYLSLSVHAVIMVAMFVNNDLRLMVYNMTSAFTYVNLSSSILDGYRICGLTYGLSQTSVLQLLGLIILPLLIQKSENFYARAIYILSAPLLVISIFISGRSGLMIGLLFSPVLIFSSIFLTWRIFTPSAFFTRLVAVISLILFLTGFSILAFRLLPEKFAVYSLGQAREIFQAIMLQGPTIDYMSTMLLVPDSWFELFFGSSNLGRGSLENIPSDIGWVKMLFSLGLSGSVLMIAPYLIALKTSFQFRKNDRLTAVTVFLVFLAAVILNSKELALLTRNQWSVQAILLLAMVFEMQKKSETGIEA